MRTHAEHPKNRPDGLDRIPVYDEKGRYCGCTYKRKRGKARRPIVLRPTIKQWNAKLRHAGQKGVRVAQEYFDKLK